MALKKRLNFALGFYFTSALCNFGFAQSAVAVIAETETQKLESLRRKGKIRDDYWATLSAFVASSTQLIHQQIERTQGNNLVQAQAEWLAEFPLRIRFENRSRRLRSRMLNIYIDGQLADSLALASFASPVPPQIQWLDIKLKNVPQGSRLFRFELNGDRESIVFADQLGKDPDLRVEWQHSLFIKAQSAPHRLSLVVDSGFQGDRVYLKGQELAEPIP